MSYFAYKCRVLTLTVSSFITAQHLVVVCFVLWTQSESYMCACRHIKCMVFISSVWGKCFTRGELFRQTKCKNYVHFVAGWVGKNERVSQLYPTIRTTSIWIEIDTSRKSIETGYLEHVSIAARFSKCQLNGRWASNLQAYFLYVRFHEALKYLPTIEINRTNDDKKNRRIWASGP